MLLIGKNYGRGNDFVHTTGVRQHGEWNGKTSDIKYVKKIVWILEYHIEAKLKH